MIKTVVRKIWVIIGVKGLNNEIVNWPYEHRDWSTEGETRIIESFCPCDGIIMLTIICDDERKCDQEFIGQISDGMLENVNFNNIHKLSECELTYDYKYSYNGH